MYSLSYKATLSEDGEKVQCKMPKDSVYICINCSMISGQLLVAFLHKQALLKCIIICVYVCVCVLIGNVECSSCKNAGECTRDLMSHCTLCPPGKFQSQPGQNQCKNCSPGSYSRLSTFCTCTCILFPSMAIFVTSDWAGAASV